MSLLDKLKKNTTIDSASVLSSSKFFTDADLIQTGVPMINVALSGHLNGGLTPGLTVFAGPSKHFKTSFALLMAAAHQKKYEDSVILFYDSEFGCPQGYFDTFGIDTKRVLHTPITDIEQLKHDVMTQLQSIEAKERVLIIVDSLGNLASKKEVDDSIEGKSVADFSRSKSIKSLFRMVTPHLRIKDIPMLVVNHTYKEIACLAGDTIIKTVRGLIPISEIQVGDQVYALSGIKKVTHTFGPETLPTEGKRYMKMTFSDNTTVRCTNNHQFLMVDNTWKSAESLVLGDLFK